MNLADTLRPVLQREAEQIVLVARQTLLHSAGGEGRFNWLQRRAIAKSLVGTVSDTGAVVSVSGVDAQAEEYGGVDRAPSPFLRPALTTRMGPLAQTIGEAVSQAVADSLARRRG